MSLKPYYERFLQVIENDVDLLLSEMDPLKRAPKTILDYLQMGQKAEEALKLMSDDIDKEWARLSPTAQAEIMKIIQKDLGVE
jgi:hypothetical protein